MINKLNYINNIINYSQLSFSVVKKKKAAVRCGFLLKKLF